MSTSNIFPRSCHSLFSVCTWKRGLCLGHVLKKCFPFIFLRYNIKEGTCPFSSTIQCCSLLTCLFPPLLSMGTMTFFWLASCLGFKELFSLPATVSLVSVRIYPSLTFSELLSSQFISFNQQSCWGGLLSTPSLVFCCGCFQFKRIVWGWGLYGSWLLKTSFHLAVSFCFAKGKV